MGLNKTASLLVQARNSLVKLQGDLAAANEKLASLNVENSAAKQVLELIAEGLIDPADALDKVAEFKAEPMKATLIKQAAALVPYTDAYTLGSVTEMGSPRDDLGSAASPEEALASRVKLIIEDN